MHLVASLVHPCLPDHAFDFDIWRLYLDQHSRLIRVWAAPWLMSRTRRHLQTFTLADPGGLMSEGVVSYDWGDLRLVLEMKCSAYLALIHPSLLLFQNKLLIALPPP